MIEESIFGLVSGNLVGVMFGLLMYRMATGAISENTKALHKVLEKLERVMK